jgi:hypothetical protein
MRLYGPQCTDVKKRKSPSRTGFRSPTCRIHSESLYRLRHPSPKLCLHSRPSRWILRPTQSYIQLVKGILRGQSRRCLKLNSLTELKMTGALPPLPLCFHHQHEDNFTCLCSSFNYHMTSNNLMTVNTKLRRILKEATASQFQASLMRCL